MTAYPLNGSPEDLEVSVPVATVWTRPEAPRAIDRDAVCDQPDVARWTDSLDTARRKGLDGRTLTQLLLGEPVTVVEDRGDWVRVVGRRQPSARDPRGYPGWVRRAHLGTAVMRAGDPSACVATQRGVLRVADTRVEVSFGTLLRVDQLMGETAGVLLPGGGYGTIPLTNVRLEGRDGLRDHLDGPAEHPTRPGYVPGEVLGSARQFLGVRYLWGGTSAWGLDCSGLVHLAYRAHGTVVPRDACDQAEDVQRVPLDAVEPGDLYFFARPGERVYHVGFATRRVTQDGTRWMLHAPEGACIEDAPMAPHRVRMLVAAGRVRT